MGSKILLADVYLQLANYEMAKTKAQEVIDAAEFQLVKVATVDDIRAKIFGATLVTSSEEIFSFKFARQTAQGNELPRIMTHPSTKLYNFGGTYAHCGDATNPFYKEWQVGNLRKGLWQIAKFGLGDSTMVNGKYAESKAVYNTGTGNDIPMYCYSELLRIYAVASARVDGITEANLKAVNQVQRRAFGLDPILEFDMNLVMTDLTVESFLDLILQEKAYETQFEGKRWLDLKRTNRAKEFVKKQRNHDCRKALPVAYSTGRTEFQ